jgi:hypothetical protein
MKNKTLNVKYIWRMRRKAVEDLIESSGYMVVETGSKVELRPLGGKTHIRKKIVKTRR